MGKQAVYGIGEALMDIMFRDGQPVAAKPGGSVLNAFVSLGRLGMDVRFISDFGNDRIGDMIEGFLKENGVSTQWVSRFDGGRSALALAFLDEKSEASYSFYQDYPPGRLEKLPDSFGVYDVVVFGSIYALSEPVREKMVPLLKLAASAGAIILYDPNFRPVHLEDPGKYKPMILENMALADIVRGSDDDFRYIFGAANAEQSHEAVRGLCPVLVRTASREGVSVHTENGTYAFPVRKLEPVSTIGAGDNFNAGMIHSIAAQKITKKSLSGLGKSGWERIVGSGISLASEVCLSYDNYISREFARQFRD